MSPAGGQVLAPTPLLEVLADAAAATPATRRLYAAIARGYPASLARRPAQLLRDADASPTDLALLVGGAGLADFGELRERAEAESGQRLPSPDLRLTARSGTGTGAGNDSTRELLSRILEREHDNLQRTLEGVQASGALELAAEQLTAARRRFVTGGLKSGAYAALLAADLTASMPGVTLVPDTAAAAVDLLTDARAGDVLVAFCLRRYSRRTVALARGFKAAGGTVVAVTDAPGGPLAPHSDVPIVVATSSVSYADSPTAVAAVVHALATLATAGAKGARRRLDRRDQVVAELEIYEKPEEKGS